LVGMQDGATFVLIMRVHFRDDSIELTVKPQSTIITIKVPRVSTLIQIFQSKGLWQLSMIGIGLHRDITDTLGDLRRELGSDVPVGFHSSCFLSQIWYRFLGGHTY